MKLTKLTVLLAGLMMAGLTASAETILVTVDVPFSFMAGGKMMPAGNYAIEESGRNGVLIIRGHEAGSASAVVIANSNSSHANHAGVTFNRHMGVAALTTVDVPGGASYSLIMSAK